MLRRVFTFLIAITVSALGLFVSVAPARADNVSLLLTQVNALRALHGIAPLTEDAGLDSVAQAWSEHMASTGVLAHNPNISTQVGCCWSNLGENVGYGGTLTIIFNLLVNSPPHLANMLTNYNLTGFGVASSNGYFWVTEDFLTRGRTTSATTPPVTHTTTAPVTHTTTAPVTHSVTTVAPPVFHPSTTVPRPTTSTSATTSTTVSTSTSSTVAPPGPSTAAPAAGGAGPVPSTAGTTGHEAHSQVGGHDATALRQVPLAASPAAAHSQAGGASAGWVVGFLLFGLVVITATALMLNSWVRSL